MQVDFFMLWRRLVFAEGEPADFLFEMTLLIYVKSPWVGPQYILHT